MQPARKLQSVEPIVRAAPAERPPAGVPYRRMNLIATGLLLGVAAGIAVLAITAAVKGVKPQGIAWAIALHALEGALVGGICDWFAVWRAYRTVELEHPKVAKALGEWVGGQLLDARVVKARLHALVDDPAVRKRIYDFVDQRLGSEEETKQMLSAVWASIEPTIVDYVVEYELDAGELGAAGKVLEDDAIVSAVLRCLGSAIAETARSREFESLYRIVRKEQGVFARFALGRFDLPSKIEAFGEQLKRNPSAASSGELGDAIVEATQVAGKAYVASWNGLSPTARRAAVAAVVGNLRAPVIRAVARLLSRERDQLRRMSSLREHPRARQIIGKVEDYVSDDLSNAVGRFVEDVILRLTPAQARKLIEDGTREHLEWVRVNGTLLGGVAGAVLGGVSHWLLGR